MDQSTIQQIQQSLPYIVPELILTVTFLAVLIGEIFSRRSSFLTFGILTIAGIVLSMFSASQLYRLEQAYAFFGMIAVDNFAIFFKFVFAVATILVVVFSFDSEELKRYSAGEYYSLILAVLIGMNLLAAANNLLMIWLSLELVSVPSYLLAGYLKDDRLSAEASVKYVIYGAVSTAVMLFGFSYLFGMSGGAYELNAIRSFLMTTPVHSGVLLIVTALILVGIGYKIGAVPFHFWCPDVYQGAPTVITAFFSIGPKAAGFALLIRFFYGAFAQLGTLHGQEVYQLVGTLQWPMLLSIVSAITMTTGNVIAIWQTSIKRMLAYSSIAHVGYMLMGFVVLRGEGIAAILFYLLVYLAMNLGAFLVVIALSSRMDSDDLSQYRGLMARSPIAASILSIFLLSLTGIPPMGGFVGKIYLFMAAVHAQYYWLVLVAVLNSVVSFVYYGGVIRRMILEEGTTREPITLPRLSTAVLALLAIAVLLMGVLWSPFADFSRDSASLISHAAAVALK